MISENLATVAATEGWGKLKESADLLTELLFEARDTSPHSDDQNGPCVGSISDLHRKPSDLGENPDGHGDILRKRIKQH